MTRKDFQLIDDALRQNWQPIAGTDPARDAIHADYCRSMARALAGTNPAFKRDLFLKACGVES